MPSIKTIPLEMLEMIADHLDHQDVASLSQTNHVFQGLLTRVWEQRLKAEWERRHGIFFAACANGAVRVVDAILRAGADANSGLASAAFQFQFESQPVSFPNIADDTTSVAITQFCQCTNFDDESFPVNITGTSPGDVSQFYADFFPSPTDHTCRTQLLFPLHLAAAFGQWDVTRLLIDHGAIVDTPSYGLQTVSNHQTLDLPRTMNEITWMPTTEVMLTPLCFAVNHGHMEVARLLLESGASRNVCPAPSQLVSVFHVAVGVQGLEMAQFCLDQGLGHITEPNYAGLPPIWLAYLNSNWEAMDLLLTLGASIDSDLAEGFTPLLHALFTDRLQAAKMLIKAGANKDVKFLTAPHTFWEAARLNPNDCDHLVRLTPLHLWIKRKFEPPSTPGYHEKDDSSAVGDFVTWLVENGHLDINEADRNGMTPMMLLFEDRHQKYVGYRNQPCDAVHDMNYFSDPSSPYPWRLAVLRSLVRLGADLMSTDAHGNTILDLCLSEWDFEACKVLCQSNPECLDMFTQYWHLDKVMDVFSWPEARAAFKVDNRLWTPCATAALKFLLDMGLTQRTNVVNHRFFGRLLCEAIEHGSEPETLSKLLLSCYPPLGKVTSPWDGKTALHHAIANNRAGLVEKLLLAGVNGNRADRGDSATLPIIQATHTPLPLTGSSPLFVLLEHHVLVHLREGPYDKDLGTANPIIAAIRGMADVDPEDRDAHRATKQYRHHLRTMLDHQPLSDPTPERNPLVDPDLIQRYVQEALDKDNSDALFELFAHGANPDTVLHDGNTPLTQIMRIFVDPDLFGIHGSLHDPEAHRRAKHALDTIYWILFFGADLALTPNNTTSKSAIRFFREIITEGSRDLDHTSTEDLSHDDNYYFLVDFMSCEEYFLHRAHRRRRWLQLLFHLLLDEDWISTNGQNVYLKIQLHTNHPARYPLPPRPERKPDVFEDWDGTQVWRDRYTEGQIYIAPRKVNFQRGSEVVIRGGAWMVEEVLRKREGKPGARRRVSVAQMVRLRRIAWWWVMLWVGRVREWLDEMVAWGRGRIYEIVWWVLALLIGLMTGVYYCGLSCRGMS